MYGKTNTWWCYLDQIQENYTEKEKSDIDVAINQPRKRMVEIMDHYQIIHHTTGVNLQMTLL